MALVYQARNLVNGKRYIGFTSRPLEVRARQHRSEARQGKGHIFHKAIRKYGPENFVFGLLADFDGDLEMAKLYEFEAISKYEPEYNLRGGGDGGGPLHESTRRKISEAQKGVPAPQRSHAHTEETKRRISATNKGHPVSAETLAKMKATWLANGGLTDKQKAAQARNAIAMRAARKAAVKCLADNREFESCRAADRFYGLSLGSTSAVATGARKYAGKGLTFVFVEKPK